MRTWRLLSHELAHSLAHARRHGPATPCLRAAETGHWNARMDPDARARSYHRWQLWLSIAGLCLAAAYLIALIATGGAVMLRDWLSSVTPRWWLQLPVALIVLGGGYRVVALPLGWFARFWLPRRFGLLHQPFHSWLWDNAKATLIGGILALLGATIVYGF